ncbi:DUF4185 domain-containing protein [Mycolicibacterium brumae]|uniref:DUF4185 domain-containing protein n=1 Tax=Mycolicibacterium brumae TaxID=85968 RepID=A0A2G5PEK2_9MYCO|nr:DUF4185 domain-containing protein [Mycolicibacterium brumae]MCV7192032.1 DUF4185 domain-containing protein [Mycolicibacterium brumae]PIB76765.1 DUF4185 domain-containing protein [Mycolicibacterium brumae]RWA20699.1 hypothetical protein MBRU_03305 [Mycolicibacterium brumae DSM 44177]UWW07797.1 DUF4185 domain-containing protein [Mycolicibacterium brumae]
MGKHSPREALVASTQLMPGQVRNRGVVAGTGSHPGVPGIGALDLGEVVRTPAGRHLAIFGDSFTGHTVYAGTHYPSVAVPVVLDIDGLPTFGTPLNGPSHDALFPRPAQAGLTNTLPSGSIEMLDGTTYMLVVGAVDLNPVGGSWLVRVTDNPTDGWTPIPGSWRPWAPNSVPGRANPHPGTAAASHPTQLSGYQDPDGMVYILADAFDRSRPVTMYRVDGPQVADRGAWQPWDGADWGEPGSVATFAVSRTNFGELSFRRLAGRPVLSGFNSARGVWQVELRVGRDPVRIFSDCDPMVVAHNDHGAEPTSLLQPYGGYILPTSTCENVNLFVSQWITSNNSAYRVVQFAARPGRLS